MSDKKIEMRDNKSIGDDGILPRPSVRVKVFNYSVPVLKYFRGSKGPKFTGHRRGDYVIRGYWITPEVKSLSQT